MTVIAAEDSIRLLTFSFLHPHSSYHVFADICSQSRSANAYRKIGGVLLFDGFRFCQTIVGKTRDVLELADRIAVDPRHHDWLILAQEGVTSDPYSLNWMAGFCEQEDLDALATLRGAAALEYFRSFLPRADVFP